MVAQSAAEVGYAAPPRITAKEEAVRSARSVGSVSPLGAPGPVRMKGRPSMWLVALIAALIVLMLVSAFILAWLFLWH